MQLTIGILISNRIETVKKCLDSIKPLLDKGIAELICVDTVSDTPGMTSDGSAELAKEYTDKVIAFPWVNDFSAARNVTIEHATGEWYVFFDDDEWFDDISEIVDFFEGGEYKNYNSAGYIIRNYKDLEGSKYADARVVRFVKLTKDLRFIGAVHENYNGLKLPCKDFSLFAHHYGYAYASEEEKQKHRERNLTLLEEEIKRRPEDLRLYTQMALELATFDNVRALEYDDSVLLRFKNEESEPYYQWLLALRIPLYEALGKGAEASEKEFKRIADSYNLSETALLAMNYGMTRIHLLENDRCGARSHITEYFRLYDILNKDKNKFQLQNAADFERFVSESVVEEMKGFRDYCMDNNNVTEQNTKAGLSGTTEEKLEMLNEMPFTEFKDRMNELINAAPACFEDEFLNAAIDYFATKSQIEYCFLLYRMAEEEIKKAVDNGAAGAAISELMIECICTERNMFEMLYKPEVFTEKGFKWVPSEVRYNDILYRFVQGNCKDLRLCIDAAKIRHDMANVMKTWLGAFTK